MHSDNSQLTSNCQQGVMHNCKTNIYLKFAENTLHLTEDTLIKRLQICFMRIVHSFLSVDKQAFCTVVKLTFLKLCRLFYAWMP